MTGWRSVGSLLGRSRLLLLAVLVVAVFAGVGFLDLAVSHALARAQYQQELERVNRLEQQNLLLQQELDRAQQNEHVPWLAWDYFGRVPSGVGVIESAPSHPAPAAEATDKARPENLWETLKRRLGLN